LMSWKKRIMQRRTPVRKTTARQGEWHDDTCGPA
jgi:hypothetical protein